MDLLKVLHIEDDPKDHELILEHLKNEGINVSSQRAHTSQEVSKALRSAKFDIILCDFTLPGYDGMSALNDAQRIQPETPFIFVSGTIGEIKTIEAMKRGATDYVLKTDLNRLVPSLRRALRDTEERTRRRVAETTLAEREKKFRKVYEHSPIGILSLGPTGVILACNPALERIFGYTEEELREKTFNQVTHPEDKSIGETVFVDLISGKRDSVDVEKRFVRKDGAIVWANVTASAVRDPEGHLLYAVSMVEDITDRKRAEKALKEVAHRYRELFDVSPVPMCVYDPETLAYLDVNRAMIEHYGYSREEFMGMTIKDIRPPEEIPALMEDVKRARTGVESTGVWKHRKKDGTIIDVEISARDFHIEGRQARLILAYDITERLKAEEAVRTSRQRLNHLLSSSPAVIYSVKIEGDRYVPTFVSENIQNVMGFARDEAMQPGWWYEHVHPEYREGVPRDMSRLFTDDIVIMEYRIRKKDGTYHWVQDQEVLIRDEVGKPLEIVGSWVDITERKAAEEALELQRSYFEQLFENSPAGIVLLDMNEHVLNVNKAFEKIFLYPAEELTGRSLSALIVPEDRYEEAKAMTQRVLRGELVSTDLVRRRKDRSVVDVTMTGYAISIGGKRVGMYGIYVDNAEQRKLENQLRQAQKLEGIGTLAGGIAHDFNNILGIILAYITILDKLAASPEKLADGLDAITKAVQRGASLVRQLLTFARQTDIKFEPVAVDAVVQELAKMLHATFPRTIELTVETQKDLPPVTADQSQLHQVLLNLCVNARDAMPEGGTISLKTAVIGQAALRSRFPEASEERYVHISVSDTGTGMTRETMSRIFDPFFTTKEAGKGTGLGLAVVYGVTRSHGGFIDVQSEVGKGTTFDIYLPVRVTSETEVRQIRKGIDEAAGGTETILLVEDEESLLSMVQSILETKGYKVLTAMDGTQAVETFRYHQDEIDLVVTDMGLPKLGGWQAALKMKQINDKIRVIFASGFLEPGMKSTMEEEGFHDFVQKPYNLNELLKRIREALDTRK